MRVATWRGEGYPVLGLVGVLRVARRGLCCFVWKSGGGCDLDVDPLRVDWYRV